MKPLQWTFTVAAGLVLAATLLTGCKPGSTPPASGQAPGAANSKANPEAPTAAAGNVSSSEFQTPFHNESQYVVYAIVSDLAQQLYYAAKHQTPDAKTVAVVVTEKPGSAYRSSPDYDLEFTLGDKKVKTDVAIKGPIWSPAVYRGVAAKLAEALEVKPASAAQKFDPSLAVKLADGTPETIERENQRVSSALEKDFTNPTLHEQAALLLGAFLLRDHSQFYCDIRSPLSRLTAHLAMAGQLRGTGAAGPEAQLAEVMMLTLINDVTATLEQLKSIDTNNPALLPLARTAQVRSTGDFRLLEGVTDRTPVEGAAWFYAKGDYIAATLVWPSLNRLQRQTIDYVRSANELGYSVEMGHELSALSLPLEIRETTSILQLSRGQTLGAQSLVTVLNELPETSCFTHTSGGQPQLRVIGWGQWANFLQRHVCHAVHQQYLFLDRKLGVHPEAKVFAASNDKAMGGLRLYPFLRRFLCTEPDVYRKSVDDMYKVIVATPQLVPAHCWNLLQFKVRFAPPYQPYPSRVDEWHNYNPLPGTVYDLEARWMQQTLHMRGDLVARLEQLHELAPNDCRVINWLIETKYKKQPTSEQVSNLFATVLPYCPMALRTVANTVYQQPEQYHKLMLAAAAMNPGYYYDLADYEVSRHNDDQAAQFLEQAIAADSDAVRIAYHSYWRVKYLLGKGETEKARQVADEAGEVYSQTGLLTKAMFLEKTKKYDEALEWYARNEERYNDSWALINFCQRYRSETGDLKFEPELQKRAKVVFPNGTEQVNLMTFKGPPTDGVFVMQENANTSRAGLRAGDVIVALNGTRTHSLSQYSWVRDSLPDPDLKLIVWQGSGYHEIVARPPDHKFGVDFRDFKAQ